MTESSINNTSLIELATLLDKTSINEIKECFKVLYNNLTLDCEISLKPSINNGYRYGIEISHTKLMASYGRHEIGYYILYYKSQVADIEPDKIKNIINMINWGINILDTIEYDKIKGKLIDSTQATGIQILEINNLRNKLYGKRIVKVNTECCVCYEQTLSVTDCNHTLCIECASNITKEDEDDNDEYACPICRKGLYF